MRNVDELFRYSQPADAKRDRSGSSGETVAAAAKAFAKVLQEHVPAGEVNDGIVDLLGEVVAVAHTAIAGVVLEPVPGPQPSVNVVGDDLPVRATEPEAPAPVADTVTEGVTD